MGGSGFGVSPSKTPHPANCFCLRALLLATVDSAPTPLLDRGGAGEGERPMGVGRALAGVRGAGMSSGRRNSGSEFSLLFSLQIIG